MTTKQTESEGSYARGATEQSGILKTTLSEQNSRLDTSEVIVTDPITGGQKASKIARFDLIPARALWLLAEVYGRGAKKYAARNWERGYAWSLSIGALERHFNAWKGGENIDEETGSHHLSQVAWHAFTLLTYQLCGLGTDDRSRLQERHTVDRCGQPDTCGTAVMYSSAGAAKETEMWKSLQWTPLTGSQKPMGVSTDRTPPGTTQDFGPLTLSQGQNLKTREHVLSEKVSAATQLNGVEEGTYRITVERERY